MCLTAEIVCGKWTLLLVRDLSEGRSRFCELERSLAGISPRTLSLRLRALEEEGIVERHTFPEVPPRVEYALTEKGRALLPIIDDMRAYGEDWLGGECARRRRAGGARGRLARERASSDAPPPSRRATEIAARRAAPSRSAPRRGELSRRMRSVQLQSALTRVPRGRRRTLQAELAAGAEVPFELEQQRGARARAGPALYCYRPLTGEFIAERRRELEALPAYAAGRSAARGASRASTATSPGSARTSRRLAPAGASARGARLAAGRRVRRADRLRAAPRAPERRPRAAASSSRAGEQRRGHARRHRCTA